MLGFCCFCRVCYAGFILFGLISLFAGIRYALWITLVFVWLVGLFGLGFCDHVLFVCLYECFLVSGCLWWFGLLFGFIATDIDFVCLGLVCAIVLVVFV